MPSCAAGESRQSGNDDLRSLDPKSSRKIEMQRVRSKSASVKTLDKVEVPAQTDSGRVRPELHQQRAKYNREAKGAIACTSG
jgi:hypothetical protein